jgi:hypothetical protein
MDAAHVVFAPFGGMVWGCPRLVVKAPAGRQRLTGLAAVDALTHALFTVEPLRDPTAEPGGELCWLLAGAYKSLPITIILDHARYQRCALVQAAAAWGSE